MIKRIPLVHQAGVLKSYFPDSKIVRFGEMEIRWTHAVKPSPLSATYTLHLRYKVGSGADIYVLSPSPLKLAKGKTKLPHVYSTPKQKLCLYYPEAKEWAPSMYYAKSLIPWACEWLVHYELWLATGDWKGGGIEHHDE